MAKRDNDGISQRTEDAIVNLIASGLVEKTAPGGRSVYSVLMDGMSATDRKLVEQSLDRHADRERKAGKAGW